MPKVLAALFLAAFVASAQQPPLFKTSTTLIQVDVVVVDQDGRPVRGLTKDDFTIVDGGFNRPIEVFAEYARNDEFDLPVFPASFKVDIADNAASRLDRIVVMVLDDLHGFYRRDDTVKRLARTIVDDLGPRATMALFTTSGKQKSELTTDRSKLLALIDAFAGDRRQRKPIMASAPHLAPIPHQSEARDAATVMPTMGPFIGDYYANVTTYKAIEDAARTLASEEGRRKAFVYISEGAPIGPSQEMMDALRQAGVTVYTIDTRGNVPHGSAEMFDECSGEPACIGPFENSVTWVESAQRVLRNLAEESGGVSVVNTDDFDDGVRRVLDDLENYYVLGFTPVDATTPGRRAIRVVAKRSDLTFRYRRSYEVGGASSKAKPIANPLVALSAGALPKSELPLKAYAAALPARGGARVAFWLEVQADADALKEADGSVRDTLQYAVIPVDVKHSKSLTGLGKTAHISGHQETTEPGFPHHIIFQVDASLDSKPGTYQFRLSASSQRMHKSGSVYVTVDVPDFRQDIALSSIILGYEGRPRVPVAATAAANAKLPFQATLDRVFDREDSVRLVCDLSRPDGASGVAATVELLNEQDALVGTLHPVLAGQPIDRINVELPLRGLTPGAYRLRVRISHGKGTASRETAFAVR